MDSNVSVTFRLLKVLGVLLIVIGASLFVLFTGAINEAQSMGSPMDFAPLAIFTYWPVVLVLDVVFLSLVLGGVKLAGFSWRIFGSIVFVAGLGILGLGILHHVTGPPLDYDSTRSDLNKLPVPFELNIIVYFWAGLTILGGFWLTAFPPRPQEIE